jgi:DMSO/TMAO reductase YedYZ molybdopterin-dependent catalytic subunit
MSEFMKTDPTIPSIASLSIDGSVSHALRLSRDDLAATPANEQVPDVSAVHPGRRGRAVNLAALLRQAEPAADAAFITFHAARDDFHVSVPLGEVINRGLVVFEVDGHPLPPEQGGPFRFLIRDPATCHSAELDECANVKYVSRIELSATRRVDTRPKDETAHAELHEAEKKEHGPR